MFGILSLRDTFLLVIILVIIGFWGQTIESNKGIMLNLVGNLNLSSMAGLMTANNGGTGAKGIQLAGLMNLNLGDIDGIQIAGLVNSGFEARGIQVAPVNYSEKATGLQCGLYNSAKSVRGIQIGFINVTQEL